MWEIINIVGLVIVVCIAWLFWTERKSKQAFDADALDEAWREMPDDDPHYAERRHYQERRRVVDQARAGTTDR